MVPGGLLHTGPLSRLRARVLLGHESDLTVRWASHGAETHFVFGTTVGADGLGEIRAIATHHRCLLHILCT